MVKAAGQRIYRKRGGQRAVLGEREKRRLTQLGICVILFAAVFLARGTDRLGALREELAFALRDNADFRGAAVDLDWSLASGQSVGKTLGSLWNDVFLPTEKESPASWREGLVYRSAREGLSGGEGAADLLRGATPERTLSDPMAGSGALPAAGSQPELPAGPQPEPAVIHVEYTGPELPDNTTMDRYALGLDETVAPVLGRLTSAYGWREHPIEGGEKFHCGVDLKADIGTPVLAFASGTVDYIGESDVYGQYLQLCHDNGVTSFYAHCSKLCVQQGQQVTVGEKVAESGATGEVTGPHLHFELKKDGVRLNPAYYIETLA